jgi:hypothetical protein
MSLDTPRSVEVIDGFRECDSLIAINRSPRGVLMHLRGFQGCGNVMALDVPQSAEVVAGCRDPTIWYSRSCQWKGHVQLCDRQFR